jgi:hypothetical protein
VAGVRIGRKTSQCLDTGINLSAICPAVVMAELDG